MEKLWQDRVLPLSRSMHPGQVGRRAQPASIHLLTHQNQRIQQRGRHGIVHGTDIQQGAAGIGSQFGIAETDDPGTKVVEPGLILGHQAVGHCHGWRRSRRVQGRG